MRYFLLGVAVLFGAQAWAQSNNESISAITFSPSRTGTYNYLKIAKKAKLGTLDACSESGSACNSTSKVNIASLGEVEVKVNGTGCSSGCNFEIKNLQPEPDLTQDEPYKTKLETGKSSTLYGSGELATLPDDVDQFSDTIISDTISNGIMLNIYNGATLQAKDGKIIIGTLKHSSPSLTLSSDGGEMPLGDSRSLKVTDTLELGGVVIKQSTINNRNFKWTPKSGYSVLGVSNSGSSRK